jgi:magnesium transporter
MTRGADFLAHALIDAVVDNVVPTIDRMTEVADLIEDEVVQSPRQSTLEAVMKLKRSTLRIYRVMTPQREVVNRLARQDFSQISPEATPYFRDVYDHIARIVDLDQNLRERADTMLSMYLSTVANRQNEVMKVLSVVATVFLPLSLLAGIYGMNFDNMPELRWSWAYYGLLGLMGTVALSIVGWFWGRRWMAWGRRKVSPVRMFMVDPKSLLGYVPRPIHQRDQTPGT